MKIPFTTEQFLKIFSDYNSGVWPMQVVFYLLGIIMVIAIYRNSEFSGKISSIILSFLWLWMGIVYHIIYFSTINKAAILFGSAFVIQALLFIHFGILRDHIALAYRNNRFANTGKLLIVFSLILYPLISLWLGHNYPESPTFGLPCPTVIFTFGVLLFSTKKIPVILLVIPFLWSLIGFSAAFTMGIYEDTGLLLAGFITVFLYLRYNPEKERNVQTYS